MKFTSTLCFAKHSKGFTLVEVLVVAPVLVVSVSILVTYMVTLLGNLVAENSKVDMNIEAQNALFNIRDDLFYAVRYGDVVQDDATDPNPPSGGPSPNVSWLNTYKIAAGTTISADAAYSSTGTAQNVNLIFLEAAYDKPRQAANRQLVYRANAPFPCNGLELAQNQYAVNTIIIYVKQNKLYRRIVTPNQANNCISTYRLTTCPPASPTPTCPADTMLAENVKSFDIVYWRTVNSNGVGAILTAASIAGDTSKTIQANRVDLTLTLEKVVNGETVTVQSKLTAKILERAE